MSQTERTSLPTWVLPGFVFLGVAALVAIALARGPVELNPDSPEGTVQEYLQAWNEQRYDDAIAVVHEDWRGSCEGSDLARWEVGKFTAELVDEADLDGFFAERAFFEQEFEPGSPFPEMPVDTTLVRVRITRGDGPFGGGWDEGVVFELVDDDDFWWIVGQPWPYFSWDCGF